MAKILLVEDDSEIAKQVREWLEGQGHRVERADNGSDGFDLLRLSAYDLAILDWELPGKTGIEVLRDYRQSGGMTPVLMLTGHDDIGDIERGLHTGADDYLTKPFAIRELAARVVALMRRAQSQQSYDSVLKTKTIELHTDTHRVLKNGQEVKLQPQEFRLLEFLMRNSQQVYSVEALLQRVWSTDSDASPDTVRVCVTRLRNKIDTPGAASSVIRTVHRLGYQIDLER